MIFYSESLWLLQKDETVSSCTDNGNNILTDHSDNESVKDQDNKVSRPNNPLQPFVPIEPSVSWTDDNQKEPSNVQKVDAGSDNDNRYSCNMCDASFSVYSVDSQEDQSQYLSMWDVWWVFLQKVLTKHFNSHHLQCPYCNLNFKNTLQRHIESVHQNVSYQCYECKSTFTREDTLQRHIESVQQKCVISMWRMQIYINSKN